MAKTDKKIDAYIAKAQPFAQPILEHFRELVHKTCPDVEEKMKWSFPHFDYKGQMMASMASFKEHMAIGFWKAPIMEDPKGYLGEDRGNGMGHFGKVTHLKDLPSDKVIAGFIKQAMKFNDEGVKMIREKKTHGKKETPAYFLTALKKNKAAMDQWKAFTDAKQREYIEWLEEAKSDATRDKRMETALEWIAEGKIRNWKYVKK